MRGVSLVLVGLLLVPAVLAQNNRSFVSTSGNDANNCTPGLECRSFTHAISLTNPGGEVLAITSGGYGAFTIGKAITVMGAPGVAAEITVTSGNAIDVVAGSTDRVVIRGINITSTGGDIGIFATSFGKLFIENCSVTGGNTGIYSAGAVTSFVTLTDSTVRASGYGIIFSNNGVASHCRTEANSNVGLEVNPIAFDVMVAASELVSVNNGGSGALANCSFGTFLSLAIDRAVISGNGVDGVGTSNVGGGIIHLFIAYSTVVQNGRYGLNNDPTTDLASMKNNLVADNIGGDVNGTITPWAGQ